MVVGYMFSSKIKAWMLVKIYTLGWCLTNPSMCWKRIKYKIKFKRGGK
jgi:hypothetical protein